MNTLLTSLHSVINTLYKSMVPGHEIFSLHGKICAVNIDRIGKVFDAMVQPKKTVFSVVLILHTFEVSHEIQM